MDTPTDILVDHGQHPRNVGSIPRPTHKTSLVNPLCNDSILINLVVENGFVKEIKFQAEGCAIMTASASLMSQEVLNKSVTEAQQMATELRQAMLDGTSLPAPLDALLPIRAYPMRVKCVTLPWHALLNALAETS